MSSKWGFSMSQPFAVVSDSDTSPKNFKPVKQADFSSFEWVSEASNSDDDDQNQQFGNLLRCAEYRRALQIRTVLSPQYQASDT